MEAPPPSPR
jgi:Glycolipid 2-alpha-mannosyltransferase